MQKEKLLYNMAAAALMKEAFDPATAALLLPMLGGAAAGAAMPSSRGSVGNRLRGAAHGAGLGALGSGAVGMAAHPHQLASYLAPHIARALSAVHEMRGDPTTQPGERMHSHGRDDGWRPSSDQMAELDSIDSNSAHTGHGAGSAGQRALHESSRMPHMRGNVGDFPRGRSGHEDIG